MAPLRAHDPEPGGGALRGHLRPGGPALDQHRWLPRATLGVREAGRDLAAGGGALPFPGGAAGGSGAADRPDRPALGPGVHPARPGDLPGVRGGAAGDALLGRAAPDLAGAAAVTAGGRDCGGRSAPAADRVDSPDGLAGLDLPPLEARGSGGGAGGAGPLRPDHPLPLDARSEGIPAGPAGALPGSLQGSPRGWLSPIAEQGGHRLRGPLGHGPDAWPPHPAALHP